MSSNEYIDPSSAQESKEASAPKKQEKKTNRVFVHLLNGEFLAKEHFTKHLPFLFFLSALMVVAISWGYYAENLSKHERRLDQERNDLDSEFYTLHSVYNSKLDWKMIEDELRPVGVESSLSSPRKIKVKRYVHR